MPGPGDVVLITGAARGIGRELALLCAERGCALVLVSRSTVQKPNPVLAGTLDEVEQEVRRRGADCLVIQADLARGDDVDRVIAATLSRFGFVDVLVNSAAVSFIGDFLTVPARRWRPVFAVNLLAAVSLLQAFLPGMLERSRGQVLSLTTGASGDEPPVPELAYAASKLALEHVSTGVAGELRDRPGGAGIDLLCVRIDELVLTDAVRHSAPQLVGTETCDAATFSRAALALLDRPGDARGRVVRMADLRTRGLLDTVT